MFIDDREHLQGLPVVCPTEHAVIARSDLTRVLRWKPLCQMLCDWHAQLQSRRQVARNMQDRVSADTDSTRIATSG